VLKFEAGTPTDDDSTADPETIGKNGTMCAVLMSDRQTIKINNMIIFKK